MGKVKLESICTIVSGSTPKSSCPGYWGGSIKWVTPAEISDETHYIEDTERHITEEGMRSCHLRMMPSGTVLLSSRAPIGKTAITKSAMCCNQGFKNLICGNSISNEYLYHFLKSKTDELKSIGRGATFKEISKKQVESITINLPALDEQNRRTAALGQIDMLLKQNRKLIGIIDDLVKSRFVEMFGALEPSVSISDACIEFIDGDWIESKDQSESGIRLIQTGNIGNGDFRDKRNRARYISEQTFEQLKCHEVHANDVLISRLPDPVGRACIVPSDADRSITAVDCSIVRLKKEWEPLFFVSYTMTKQYEHQIQSYLTGTTRKRISRSNLGRIKIPAASFALQQEFAAFVSQVDKLRFEACYAMYLLCAAFTLL